MIEHNLQALYLPWLKFHETRPSINAKHFEMHQVFLDSKCFASANNNIMLNMNAASNFRTKIESK